MRLFTPKQNNTGLDGKKEFTHGLVYQLLPTKYSDYSGKIICDTGLPVHFKENELADMFNEFTESVANKVTDEFESKLISLRFEAKVNYNDILKSISKINLFIDFDYFTLFQLCSFKIIDKDISKFPLNFK
jgi:hypothetical protein